jgi:alkylation response protein AidB-like acyl-CoA dehydrogenase
MIGFKYSVGSKAWITNSGEAGFFVVFANVDHSLGYKGITAFLVDGANPGISVGKREDKVFLFSEKWAFFCRPGGKSVAFYLTKYL